MSGAPGFVVGDGFVEWVRTRLLAARCGWGGEAGFSTAQQTVRLSVASVEMRGLGIRIEFL
jgi:hypothetical protein